MPISRAQMQKELIPGLHALIGLEYEDYGKEWSEIFEVETSKRNFEEEQKLVGFGRAAAKGEGESVFFDEGAGEAWTARYTHTTYALGFIMTEEAMEDNLYDSLGKRYSKQLGRSMAKTKEYVCANVLNLGFNSSYPGGDGVALFSASHPTASGITNSNYSAVGTDLNEATLENALIQIAGWVDERGMLIAAKANKLIVPPALQFIAKRILGSEYRPGSADNDINASKAMGVLPKGYAVNHYLANPQAWFLITNVPDGFKMFQRAAIKTNTEGDFNTGNLRVKSRERYSVGFSDPLCGWGSLGAF